MTSHLKTQTSHLFSNNKHKLQAATYSMGEQELGVGCGWNSRQWLRCSVDSLTFVGVIEYPDQVRVHAACPEQIGGVGHRSHILQCVLLVTTQWWPSLVAVVIFCVRPSPAPLTLLFLRLSLYFSGPALVSLSQPCPFFPRLSQPSTCSFFPFDPWLFNNTSALQFYLCNYMRVHTQTHTHISMADFQLAVIVHHPPSRTLLQISTSNLRVNTWIFIISFMLFNLFSEIVDLSNLVCSC